MDGGAAVRRRRPLTPRQKAKWASLRFSRLHPWQEWGAARIARGSPWSLTSFGATRREATDEQKQNRRLAGFTGRGLYTGRGRYNLRDFGHGVMNVYRTVSRNGGLRGMANAFTGQGLYTGRGAYIGAETHANNLLQSGAASKNLVPQITGANDETGGITIKHREYIGDIYGPTTPFNVQSYALNPALQSTFPWLSQIASNYDEYEFIQMVWTWRSTTSDIGNSSTGQVGTVLMCTNYNAAAPFFTDKGTMMDYAHAHSCKTTDHMEHFVECDPKKTALSASLYTRAASVPAGQDAKTYDHGLFQIALCNIPTAYQNLSLGELHVEYTVLLRKPKLFVTRGLEIDIDTFSTSAIASIPTTGSQPFGNNNSALIIYRGYNNNIGCQLNPGQTYTVASNVGTYSNIPNGFNVTFPANYTGNLQVRVVLSTLQAVAGGAIATSGFTLTGNVVAIRDMFDANSQPSSTCYSQALAILTAVAIQYVQIIHLYVKASTGSINNSINLTYSTGCSSSVQSFLSVQQYNGNGQTQNTDLPQYVNPANPSTIVAIPLPA